MLILRLLSHGWKQWLRSASRGQNIAGPKPLLSVLLIVDRDIHQRSVSIEEF